jgi:hydrogenase expression/formation protein HypE
MNPCFLPLGKLPPEILTALLAQAPIDDNRLIVGPGIGLDCAVIDMGATLLTLKTDPITFATDEIGWYTVQVNANDIATTGALPHWFLVTLLLPQERTTQEMVEGIAQQLFNACREHGIVLAGGHTEITAGLDRPIIVGTMIGEVDKDKLVTSRGAQPGDRLLLTKGVPIEATALLAREFPDRLRTVLTSEEIETAANFLYDPGISVLRDARLALAAGNVTAMHDPTEGGLASAVWELAQASQRTIHFDPCLVPVPPLSARICCSLGIDPLSAIASGALLLTCPKSDAAAIQSTLQGEGIPCAAIGSIEDSPASVLQLTQAGYKPLLYPERDAIAKLFE